MSAVHRSGDPGDQGPQLALIVQTWHERDELITRPPGQLILRSKPEPQPSRHLPQRLVARCMSSSVVDGLEAVHVDEQHGAATCVAHL
jgi:hypothetical protein